MRNYLATALAAALVVFLATAWPAPRLWAEEEWMLMGREGGCVTLAQAGERREELNGITTPDEFEDRLRELGEEVRRQDLIQGEVNMVQIDAPGLGLGLIFVPRSLCR